jgi:hypothetical protein
MSASLKYDQYLRTDCWWNQTRQCALQRAGYYCEAMIMNARGQPTRCPRVATEVHHLTYERVGRERPEDLLCVCSAHHRALHNRPAKLPRPANDNQLPLFHFPGEVELKGRAGSS